MEPFSIPQTRIRLELSGLRDSFDDCVALVMLDKVSSVLSWTDLRLTPCKTTPSSTCRLQTDCAS